jgi:hypothetical protein
MRSFLTGSHIYGKPTKKSDIDLVVLVSLEDLKLLKKHADLVIAKHDEGKGSSVPQPKSASLRFGKLNLLALTDEAAFACWKLGTEKLEMKMHEGKVKTPIKRDEAVKLFKKMFRIYLGDEE